MSEAIQLAAFDQAGEKLNGIEAAYRKAERAAKAANRVIENVDLEKVYRAGIDLMDRAKLGIYALAAAQERAVLGAVRFQNSWKSVYEAIQKAVSAASAAAAETVTVKTSGDKKEDSETKFGFQDAASKGIDLLTDKFKNLKYVMLALQGLSAFQKMSDAVAETSYRLDLMNDGTRTTAELQRKVLNVASRSRSTYFEMEAIVSNLAVSAKDMFGSNDELLAFSELLTKNVEIGGASNSEQSAVIDSISSVIAEGSLQGDDFQSVLENAPVLAGAIESYMTDQGVIGSLEEWAEQGLLTGEAIRNAMFSCADQTEERFQQIPMTWAQIFEGAGNVAIRMLRPLLNGINWLANQMDALMPVFVGATAAVLAYAAGLGILILRTNIASGKVQAFFLRLSTSLKKLFTSPVFWIAIVIAVIVALIYKWIQSVGGIEIAWAIAVDAVLTILENCKIAFMSWLFSVMEWLERLKLGFTSAKINLLNI